MTKKSVTPISLILLVALAAWSQAGDYYSAADYGEGIGRKLYSFAFLINGAPAEVGDEVGAFDTSGVLKGRYTVDATGWFGFMAVCGNAGDVISFRVVDKSRKREYVVTNTFTMEGPEAWFDSYSFNLIIGDEYDSDSDGMCDYWESHYAADGFDPAVWNDPDGDSDADGLTDILEYDADTSPGSPDTDGDGYSDLLEIDSGTDPNDPGAFPGTVRINFAPPDSVSPAGYSKDDGQPIDGRGFGWKPG